MAARTTRIVSRIPAALAEAVDELVRVGVYESRSDAVRSGLVTVIERGRGSDVGRAIVDGYRRVPQAANDLGWPDSASAAMIADEPW